LTAPAEEAARARESVLDLLVGTGSVLGLQCISFVLETPAEPIRGSLGRLTSEGLLERRQEHHSSGWRIASDQPAAETAVLPGSLADRLVEYALTSPGATLSEMMAAIGQCRGKPEERMNLFFSAMQLARENGEFRMVAGLVEETIKRSEDTLPESRVIVVLRIMDPRRLRELDNNAARAFIQARIDLLSSPSSRILALTRLGELEMAAGHLPKADMFLTEGLRTSMSEEVGEWVPEILDNLAELSRDYDRMSRAAELFHEVIAWTPALEDDDIKLRVLATAAAALARIQRFKAAEMTIQSAMALAPQASPESRMVLEWCRARIHVATGRLSTAVGYLERALLLAENINDQVSVSEILDVLVFTMKEQPGYTIRSLTAIMERVSRRATTSGNISNQLYALNHLADMYLRTLQMEGLAGVRNEIDMLRTSAGLVVTEPVADWCFGFMRHICGGSPLIGDGDTLIPGSAAFLSKLALHEDPLSEAKVIGDFFVGRQRVTSFAYGLFMAMEACVAGFSKAAATMAVPLQETLERMSDEPEPSWKLALSALLAEEPRDADDFFGSAQVLARQMDRLLLVWQILRCRSSLTLRRELQDQVEIDLLILELDEYIASRLPHDDRDRFLAIGEVRSRRERMERLSQRAGPSVIIRDALTVRMTPVPGQIMEKVDRLSLRFSSRSEISWSLEALGTVTGAKRIQALQVKNGELRIIESYGLGRERLPGSEVADIVRSCPDTQVIVDAFGSNPFGSRRFTVIPTTRRGEQVGRERRSQATCSEVDSFVLLETDSPFDTIGSAGFMVSCFVRQIGSSLMLRERETQSYYDAMTGAAIRSSWMKKLGELLEMSVSPGTPLSVLLVDIDRFKRVNDSFGHHEGDRILRETVSAIAGALRPNDIIGRIGGDEFGIILPSASSDNAVLIADRVCRKVSSTVFLPDQVPMTISIGISTADSDRCHSDLLISRADAALYQSKESGRNRVTQWTPASDAAGEERKRFSILDTGDPGWDHTIGQTVMELLSTRRGDVTLDVLAGKLRDVLRCEYLYLEDAAGNSAEVGPSFARRVRELVPRGYPGRISEHSGILGRFYALASLLTAGGWLLAAWEGSDRLPVSIRGVFSALVSLSDMLTEHR
jgi:diguanylate cyclase (GGDEF)-like protein